MLNLGVGEVLVIALIALIVLGPEKIPGAMRQVGRFMGEMRRISSGFQDELRSALEVDDDEDDAEMAHVPATTPAPPAPSAGPTPQLPPDAGPASPSSFT
jgi:sec-independent protein translocase protein TatB